MFGSQRERNSRHCVSLKTKYKLLRTSLNGIQIAESAHRVPYISITSNYLVEWNRNEFLVQLFTFQWKHSNFRCANLPSPMTRQHFVNCSGAMSDARKFISIHKQRHLRILRFAMKSFRQWIFGDFFSFCWSVLVHSWHKSKRLYWTLDDHKSNALGGPRLWRGVIIINN